MSIAIRAVQSKADLDRFIRFPFTLYADDPCFVPPLLQERRVFFDPKRNPLFEFVEAAHFLAEDPTGKAVGCITAHIHRRHNQTWNEQTGFFGFFECINSSDVARALFTHAEAWLRDRGMKAIRGPFNFSTNGECGLLTEGFDRPPVILMTYNKRYYLELINQCGYRQIKELYAYEYQTGQPGPEFLERLSGRVKEKSRITIRCLDKRRFQEEVSRAFGVYNAAWQRNWGFIPMTEAEFRFMADGLKHIIDPTLALFAEEEGRPAGFALALPDYNQPLKKMNGRLWPFGFVHLLLGRRQIDTLRIFALGVLEEYRGRGIDVLLYDRLRATYFQRGYRRCEMSWILEDNELMNRALKRVGAVIGKRYLVLEKSLHP